MTAVHEPTVGDRVLDAFADAGVRFATGVPCSLLAGLFHGLENDGADPPIRYARAPREDTAVGLAVGAMLAGERSLVLMQNSGLGYCLNALTSLTLIYRIHPVFVISWRGHDGTDAVEHDVIGRELPNVLRTVDTETVELDIAGPEASVAAVMQLSDAGRSAALLVRTGV